MYSRVQVFNSQAWLTSNARKWTKGAYLVIIILDNQCLSVVSCILLTQSRVITSCLFIRNYKRLMKQRFLLCKTNPRTNPWTLWWSMTWYRRLTCIIVSKATPEDHLIILCEFLAGNKAHATSSSIRVQVNCSRASVKLHLSCTVSTNGTGQCGLH